MTAQETLAGNSGTVVVPGKAETVKDLITEVESTVSEEQKAAVKKVLKRKLEEVQKAELVLSKLQANFNEMAELEVSEFYELHCK